MVTRGRRRQRTSALVVALVVLVTDQATKWLAWRHIDGAVVNQGGFLVLGPDIRAWFAQPAEGAIGDAAGVTLVGAGAAWLLRIRRHPEVLLGCALIAAGWLSNLLDRIGLHDWTAPGSPRGVVDFVPTGGSGRFNVADVWIVIGVAVLIHILHSDFGKGGRVTALRVWAPKPSSVHIVVDGKAEPMHPDGTGWWTGPDLAPGTDYAFVLDDADKTVPDPASRWQPEGVHGPSRVYDQGAFDWTDSDWRGRDLTAAIIYELHIATFTPGATFDAAIERLDHLVELGVTHVEVLPVNAVNGTWNWGYDGVGWYAVHEPLGGPDGFKRFVDAAHSKGLAVVLDVVYNHLGPSGNYLPDFGPYLKSGHNTWGDLVNVEEPAVREFILENALMWLRDYHVDALRLDAVHALQDSSPQHILAELAERVGTLAKELDRPLTLIAESDLNDPVMIEAPPDGYGLDAQWDDDVHHALHAAITGERQGYYCDFGSLEVLAKVLTHAFLHDGTYSSFRQKVHGRPVDREHTPGWRFVVALQNHDQVGNRAVGDRLPELTTPGLLRVGAVLLLTSPFTPMLWMGEEWAASTRWPFFTSHPEPDLASKTSEGRIEEFAGHGWDASQMIDPQDPQAYREAILDWAEVTSPGHVEVLALYQRLIALRAAEPDLADGDLTRVHVDFDEDERWLAMHRGSFVVAANLADAPRTVPVPGLEVVVATGEADANDLAVTLGPESAAVLHRAR